MLLPILPLRKLARATGLAVLAATVVGCASSPIPVVKNFPLTEQKKVRSAGHWELVAGDVVSQTLAMMRTHGLAEGSNLYVGLPGGSSSFDRAFRDMLITELVSRGQNVLVNPDGAVEINYNAQLVKHHSARPDFVPGRFTMLAAGLVAAYGVSTLHLDGQIVGGVAAAGLGDWAASESTGGPTHTELVLTTSVTTPERYIARKTDVYYIEDIDASLFSRAPSSKPISVVAE